MKKSEMIEVLANKTGLTKADCEKVFNATFDLFKDELAKGEKVSVSGFGVFKISERSAREGILKQGKKLKLQLVSQLVLKQELN